jgi:WD40 repeat protein
MGGDARSRRVRRPPESNGAYRAVLALKNEFVVSALGQLWRWQDQTSVAKLFGADEKFFSMAVSPQGDKVAVGTTEGKIQVWWLITKAHKMFDQGGLITSVTFSRGRKPRRLGFLESDRENLGPHGRARSRPPHRAS